MPSYQSLAQCPSSRYLNGGGIDGSKRFYQIAGFQNSNGSLTPASDVWRYNPTTSSWESVASLPQTRTYHAGCQDLLGRVYALFGTVNNQNTEGSALRYDPATNAWSAVATSPYGSNTAKACMDANGDIYVAGGENPQNGYLRKYTVSTNSWSLLASLPVSRAGGYLCRDASGRLYYIAGYDFQAYTTSRTVYRWDPATNAWTSVSGVPVDLSGGGSGYDGVNGGRLYVLANGPQAWTYSVASNAWSSGPTAVNNHTGSVADACAYSRMYVSGAQGAGGVSPTSFMLLNVLPSAPTWTAPAEGAVLDRTQPIRTQHVHNDGDGDAQNGFDLRYRPKGSLGPWVLVFTPGNAMLRDWPALTFAGYLEAQIRTYDGEGPGDWSTVRTFSALDPAGASGPASTVASRLDPMALQAWVNSQRALSPAVV